MTTNLCRWAILFVPLATISLGAENWPEFRGPTGQGHSTERDLPIERSNTKNVAWKQPVPGQGWSSPVFYEGRVYLTSAVRTETKTPLSLRTLCLAAADGKTLWNTEVFVSDETGSIHSKNSHASPTPVVEGERIYVHFGHHGTAQIGRATFSGNTQFKIRLCMAMAVHPLWSMTR